MKAVDIQWDTDGDKDAFEMLPSEMKVPDGLTDDGISDFLSDETGFCHFGYCIEYEKENVRTYLKKLESGCGADVTRITGKDISRIQQEANKRQSLSSAVNAYFGNLHTARNKQAKKLIKNT